MSVESLPVRADSLLQAFTSNLEDFAVILLTPEYRFCFWHKGVHKLFGYTADEFLGQPVDIIYPEADRQSSVIEDEMRTAREDGRASDTRELRRRDGTSIMVEGVTVAIRSSAGELLGYGKVLVDYTERKQTEDRLQTIAQALNLSNVIVRSWDGIIQHWTLGCERLYGYTAEQAIGADCQALLKTDYPVPTEQVWSELLSQGIWRGEIMQTTRSGVRLTIAAEWALLRDETGNPRSVIETQTDVTERVAMRKKLEVTNRELQALTAELERSNAELSDFARIASHDLSAPLTSAGWLIDLLAARHSHQLDERGQGYVRQVRQSLSRMSELMDGILAHARAGMSPVRTSQSSDADAALTTALEDLRHDIDQSNAFIARDALPPVPVAAQAMTQLFQNLISNAIKYRKPDERPSIRIRVNSEDGAWLFSVQDNGQGIDSEWHERIFQPMQRLHDSSIPGSGIGLATCRKIVNRAGGRIWVESQPNGGSTFFFTLPKASAEPTPSASA